jgi:ABC-type antimicrobial peptide transport system permease subunit
MHDMREEMHDLTHITHVDAARQAYVALWGSFVVVPLLFGIDKFAGFLGVKWDGYLANWVHTILPGSDARAVMMLGVVEILLACAVALKPRVGGDLSAFYLVLAAFSAFALGGGGMVVLGVMFFAAAVCALAMARLSTTYHRS